MNEEILNNRLAWTASHNGISVQVDMDIRVHPAKSDKIVIIIGGVDASVDGYKDKYAKMAQRITEKQGKAAVRFSNDFISSFHWEENLRHALKYVDEHAVPITGMASPEVEIVAHSAGASVALWLAHEYPQVTKMLLINTAAELGLNKILRGLARYKNKALLVFGSLDNSLSKFQTVVPNHPLIIIEGANHQFSSLPLEKFIQLVDLLD